MTTRREFLAEVARGMVVASIGCGAAAEIGLAPARADEPPERLSFSRLDRLVSMMEETPPDRLLALVVAALRDGAELRDLVAAGALANARRFGGEDYVGFHTMMALAPAYHMSAELPSPEQALPVLKVLYRNASRIQERGGGDTLFPVAAASPASDRPGPEALREAVRAKDLESAERTFASLSRGPIDEAFNDLLIAVQDATEVHRVVLPYRAWDLLDIVGEDHAHTILRQSVRYCVKSERSSLPDRYRESRALLPAVLDQHGLLSRPLGERPSDDGWVERMARTIFESSAAEAARAAAAALAEGFAPDAVGEAISLAANQLVLRDRGRTEREAQPGKPVGSVHGDSIGVHACDSANAWRFTARVANPRNAAASLILGAFQAAFDRVERGGDFVNWQPHPLPEELEKVRTRDPSVLLAELDAAVRTNDQARAAALVHRYGELGHPERAVFDLFLRHAVSEDGALHAEKYYRTVAEEFRATRPAFRWRQLVALARVTASEHGRPAPGVEQARDLLAA